MHDRFLALWRTAAQALFPLLLTVLLNHGIHVPDTAAGWVQAASIAAGAGVWAYGTHWLQSRTGGGWWARAARFVGRALVLGAGALPSYAQPATPPAVTR